MDGYSAILVTRFDNSLVLAGGVQRVALQAAYASCEISYWSYDYHRDQLSVANSVNYLNFYAGLYFGLKKKYRPKRTE